MWQNDIYQALHEMFKMLCHYYFNENNGALASEIPNLEVTKYPDSEKPEDPILPCALITLLWSYTKLCLTSQDFAGNCSLK